MAVLIIAAVAFFASALTFFSGFGLGTLLLPAFAAFFPLPLAIAMTAIVHLLNNLFKLALTGKSANREILLRFGIPSIIFAAAGAFCLIYAEKLPPLAEWSYGESKFQITPLKLLIAGLIFLFAWLEVIPAVKHFRLKNSHLMLGGALSGFFGGLSGHQGALRSMFLVKSGISKESIIGTGVIIACFVDITRMLIYGNRIALIGTAIDWQLVIVATVAAFEGAWLGNRYLKKITLRSLQLFVTISLLTFSLFLGAGII